MAELLRNSDSTVLSINVATVYPKKDTTQVINKLLSGAYHVQTIGVAPTKVIAEVTATRVNMLLINGYQATGEDLKIIYKGYYYIGFIEEQPDWELIGNSLYSTTLTLLSSSEGNV